MENSFRPPYYHRNTMSEFSFLLKGGFDTDPLPPQLQGMYNLANVMSAHGPTNDAFKKATTQELKPHRIDESNMGVMFESWYAAVPSSDCGVAHYLAVT